MNNNIPNTLARVFSKLSIMSISKYIISRQRCVSTLIMLYLLILNVNNNDHTRLKVSAQDMTYLHHECGLVTLRTDPVAIFIINTIALLVSHGGDRFPEGLPYYAHYETPKGITGNNLWGVVHCQKTLKRKQDCQICLTRIAEDLLGSRCVGVPLTGSLYVKSCLIHYSTFKSLNFCVIPKALGSSLPYFGCVAEDFIV